jgi:hypothetical protein
VLNRIIHVAQHSILEHEQEDWLKQSRNLRNQFQRGQSELLTTKLCSRMILGVEERERESFGFFLVNLLSNSRNNVCVLFGLHKGNGGGHSSYLWIMGCIGKSSIILIRYSYPLLMIWVWSNKNCYVCGRITIGLVRGNITFDHLHYYISSRIGSGAHIIFLIDHDAPIHKVDKQSLIRHCWKNYKFAHTIILSHICFIVQPLHCWLWCLQKNHSLHVTSRFMNHMWYGEGVDPSLLFV